MASGTKSGGVFTGNPMGDGKSAGVTSQKVPGGTIRCDYAQDNIHGLDLPNTRGKELAGGPSNLSHSLKGASAVQDHSSLKGKTESSGI